MAWKEKGLRPDDPEHRRIVNQHISMETAIRKKRRKISKSKPPIRVQMEYTPPKPKRSNKK